MPNLYFRLLNLYSMIVNLYSSIITYLPSVSGRRMDSWRMHSPEWQRQSCILSANPNAERQVRQKTWHGYPPSNRQPWHKPNLQLSLHPPYSKHKVLPPDDRTSGKTAVSAIQTLRLLARTYYNYTFSLQNVVRITEKELHTVLFNHSDHLFRQLLNVFTRNQRTSITSIPFPFGAVRAAVSICLATSSTCSWRQSRSFCYHSLSFLN